MLRMALLFLLIAIIAGALGLYPVAWLSADLARIFFFVFIVLFVLALVGNLSRGSPRDVI